MQRRFNDIRPYLPAEIPPAMQRIADSRYFERLSEYVFPGENVEDVRAMVRQISTTGEFQQKVMYFANRQIISRSIDEFTCSGLDGLHPEKNYLFVSNHRDIMLDSSLFQYVLHSGGFRTTEITFGSNLMHTQFVVDVGRANKMFKVVRSGNMRDFLENARHLSDYIRYTVTEKGESVWIAQRNGRTKDGNDATDRGIIKMFCMSSPDDLPRSAAELNIAPLAVSYQIESCDILKVRELYFSRGGRKYVKQPDEDLNSILTGIMQPKGRVHISICRPVEADELAMDCKCPNEFYRAVASLIDRRIYENYKLYDNNYIAHDMRSKTGRYSDFYTREAKEIFSARTRYMLEQLSGDRETLTSLFLGIYAAPVDNAKKITP
jgi:hypothetical protein